MTNKTKLEILKILIQQENAWEPPCDVSFINNKIIVELDIPSLDISSLSVNIINGTKLEVVGKRNKMIKEEGVYIVAERVLGTFKKIIDLPFYTTKTEEIKYIDGTLKITLTRS